MKARYLKVYVSKKGNDTFIYTVEGTQEELAEYKEAKGEFHRVDDETGKPLFFNTNYVGETCNLEITTNGNVVADTSELKKAISLAKQTGGNLGDAVAAGAGQMLLNTMFGGSAPSAQAPATPTPQVTETPAEEVEKAEEVEPDLNNL